MWLFTRYGFYSVSVQGGKTVVRARLRKHLDALIARFPTLLDACKVESSANTDYRYRIRLEKELWSQVAAELVSEQDWSNFKNEVHRTNGSDSYEMACHKVWSVMYQLQQKEPI